MYKVVLVGCGGFGTLWYEVIKNQDVVAVVDPKKECRENAKAFFGLRDEQCFLPDGEWENCGADILVDCSPFFHHYDNAARALSKGMHLLTAKPLCSNMKDALKLVQMVNQSEKTAFVAQQKRYYPVFRELRKLLQDGLIGKVETVKVNMNLSGLGWMPGYQWRSKMSEPTLYEAAIHQFDIMRAVFQCEIESVLCHSWNPSWSPFQGNSSLWAILKTNSGITIQYDATFAAKSEEFVAFDSGWTMEGTDGVLTIRSGNIYLNGRLFLELEVSPPLEVLNQEVWNQFVTAIDSKQSNHELSYKKNIGSLFALFACEQSIQQGRWIHVEQLNNA
ncbi:Gfo/Idh/MocA family protein [Paenibacillus periandrae]|uniref:Gfo/Idh/MocA family protein n=1 Tax=Paenibacillus periandrae TaxID=1761741 RepID=UPI001F09E26A|nr:Gfo/Idh/MocA family oxidoreductase [Paenibacillus periandrae]